MSVVHKNRAVFSSIHREWATPRVLFQAVDAEFNFTLDVCATKKSAKCDAWFGKEMNGLIQDWAPHACWMNPPYGTGMDAWVAKAEAEAKKGATVVGLLPARTDTIWWHTYALKATEIRFIRGRLHFDDGKGKATFPSVLVVWRPK